MTCDNCRIECKKAGKRSYGTQRYRCSTCGKTFSQHREYTFHKQLDDDAALMALRLIVEGNSIRSASRITGLHRDTITNLIVTAGTRCEALLATYVRNIPVNDVQADEIWGFG